LQDAVSGQRSDSGSQRRTADAEQLCEVAFRGQPIASLELSAVDHFAKVNYDFLGAGAALI
jgi:hypothetical protein